MKIEIKHKITSKVLFTHEQESNTVCHTVKAAVEFGANLTEANLAGADLTGADLSGANLFGANLTGANLFGAYLSGAYLSRACLSGANLFGANLTGADLTGAYLTGADLSRANLSRAYLSRACLSGAKLEDQSILIGERPVLCIGPIGSRGAYLTAYLTNDGVRLRAGCFFGSVEKFENRLVESDEATQKEYRAALALVSVHEELWK